MSSRSTHHSHVSYTPYSDKQSVCYVKGKSGVVYPGVRVENASFPLTIAASQVAFFSCLSENDTPVTAYVSEDSTDERLEYLSNFHGCSIHSIDEINNHSFYNPIIDPTSPIDSALISLRQRAVVSESNFRVSCILELIDGRWITGVNIEYPDWQIGLCAERVAICKAVSHALTETIKTVHISASSGSFISPCGACRQVLVEHVPYKSIHLHHPDGSDSMTNAAQLLPAFFNGSSLRK